MTKILGLDIGSNSIGWALIDDGSNQIIDSGVRIFQEGVNEMNTKKEESKNATRREARQIRRRYYRRKKRKERLINYLTDIGLLPEKELENIFKMNPYELRKEALQKKLELNEIGRVIYHLNQRRGFKSNRKDSVNEKNDKDLGVVKNSISELRQEIKKKDYKTLGEYLASLNPHEIRIRNRYTERGMYEEEFDIIWEVQKEYYPDILTDENRAEIKDRCIFYQRPLKSQKGRVGKCKFEKRKRRAPISSPISQEYRMLQQVNNFRISGGNRIEDEQQILSSNEREILLDYLSKNPELKFTKTNSKIKKLLGLGSKTNYRFNLETQGKINGLKTITLIRKALGSEFGKFNADEIHKLWHVLYFSDDEEWLINFVQKKWGLDINMANKLNKIKLEKGYLDLSTNAINKIIPYLREGMMYHEAALEAGYHHSQVDEVEILDHLPEPPKIANPIVMVTLYQLRKVFNQLIERYGKPDTIRIEMARDLKNSLQKRLEILSNNRDKDKYHKRIEEELKNELNIENPSRDDIVKYKLWEECDRICPYTGKQISLHQLYVTGEVDIEHILPYSRTLDNSYMNLSLCFREENARKGNKTPYEAYSNDQIKYSQIKERIKKLPDPKTKRFFIVEIDLDDFISRQLNDTRYISREALKYLKHITKNVAVTSGIPTATLRYLWGMNSIIAESLGVISEEEKSDIKSRENHKHHAIDAIVVALTTTSYLQQMSKYHRLNRLEKDSKDIKEKFPLPCKNFRNDVRNSISNIVISHRTNKKVRGTLHKETIYGAVHEFDGTQKKTADNKNIYVVRKPLANLTHSEVHKIIDPEIKAAVLGRLTDAGIDVEQKKFNIPNNAFAEPLYLTGRKTGKKTKIKSVRIQNISTAMIEIREKQYVEPGNNHHIIIYSDEDGKVKGKVVSLFEAYQRKRNGIAIIDKKLEPNQEFIMSLQRNEMIIVGEIPDGFDMNEKSTYHLISNQIYRVQKMDISKKIVFRLHDP